MIKIQFGSGNNMLDGWDNTDLPRTDVRKRLRYKDDSVDFIFHEHMIEHLDEVDGYNFMEECFRILKEDGVMRICCPSIDGFISVYENWDEVPEDFKKRHVNKTRFINDVTLGETVNYTGKKFSHDGRVVPQKNSHRWHKYLYDKEDFVSKLTKIGFSEITFTEKHKSDYVELQNLERRYGHGIFLYFPPELDIVLEAKNNKFRKGYHVFYS